jgi:hypothetical protein
MSSSFRYVYRNHQEQNLEHEFYLVDTTGRQHDVALPRRVSDFDEGYPSYSHQNVSERNFHGGNRCSYEYQDYHYPNRTPDDDLPRHAVYDYNEVKERVEPPNSYRYSPNIVRENERLPYARRPSRDDSISRSHARQVSSYYSQTDDNPGYIHGSQYVEDDPNEEDSKISAKSSVGRMNPGAFQQSRANLLSKVGGKEMPRVKTVEVSPGVFLRLRGAEETWKAIHTDNYVPCSCICCEGTIFSIDDAVFVLCPLCDAVSPIQGILADVGYDGGVGLGFSLEELGQWQREIERNMSRSRY